MIGVALVGLITVFAASAKTSVGAAIDRSMMADYVDHVAGLRPGIDSARRAAAVGGRPRWSRRPASGPARPRSTDRSTQLIAADPAQIDSLFDLQPKEGTIADLTENGIAVLDTTASDNGWKLGDTVPITFPRPVSRSSTSSRSTSSRASPST